MDWAIFRFILERRTGRLEVVDGNSKLKTWMGWSGDSRTGDSRTNVRVVAELARGGVTTEVSGDGLNSLRLLRDGRWGKIAKLIDLPRYFKK